MMNTYKGLTATSRLASVARAELSRVLASTNEMSDYITGVSSFTMVPNQTGGRSTKLKLKTLAEVSIENIYGHSFVRGVSNQ